MNEALCVEDKVVLIPWLKVPSLLHKGYWIAVRMTCFFFLFNLCWEMMKEYSKHNPVTITSYQDIPQGCFSLLIVAKLGSAYIQFLAWNHIIPYDNFMPFPCME